MAKQLRFCIIWGTEPLFPTLVLITAFGVFLEGGQRVRTEVGGIFPAADQSWSERSLYKTLKIASVLNQVA